MNLPDINILIYAFRPEMEHHLTAKNWLEASLSNGQFVYLFPTVEAGFTRIVTHPNLFKAPSPLHEAHNFLNVLCSSPFVDICPWTNSARERWLKMCNQLDFKGNDCNDAMLAAIAMDRGYRLVTFDKGFQRFKELRLSLLN